MHSLEIAPKVYWVGFIDWDVRDFHGYQTHRGSSYNAYLVVDEKIALIDAVKAGHGQELLRKVAEIVSLQKVDYVISNHTEPDHSGELPLVMAHMPQATLVASAKGKDGLIKYYPGNDNIHVVKTGDTISLGSRTLQFINTPMLHWPDSMFTYIPEQKLLFSMDAFGQHLASNQRFDTQVDKDVLFAEAKTYYANIIMHLGSVVERTLKQAADLPIDIICPSHGVIWTKLRSQILSRYQDWAQCKPIQKVLVVYDTMWHSTEIMAESITESITDHGIEVKKMGLSVNDLTLLMTEVLDAAAIIVGSPTLNNNMMPTVAAFLTYMKGLKPKGKIGFAFGSYGWSGGAVDQVAQNMKETGIDLICDPISCAYRPDSQTLQQCRQAADTIAQAVKQIDQN